MWFVVDDDSCNPKNLHHNEGSDETLMVMLAFGQRPLIDNIIIMMMMMMMMMMAH